MIFQLAPAPSKGGQSRKVRVMRVVGAMGVVRVVGAVGKSPRILGNLKKISEVQATNLCSSGG